MITRKSTTEEISSYFDAKIAQYMELSHELETLKGRDMSVGRENFRNEWSLYNPLTNRTVVVDQAVNWMDGQIAQMERIVAKYR